MSAENEQTIAVYQQYANKYMENTILSINSSPKEAELKEKELNDFLLEGFSTIGMNASIFEIGSGAGENALFLKSKGYNVTASDVADAFLQKLEAQKLKFVRFNILKDVLPQQYAGVLCWRVFVHFTKKDAKIVLKKVYDTLEEKGRFIFNAMNCQGHEVDSEWLDFPGDYHIGVDRFYQYYDESDLNQMIFETGFKIIQLFHKGGIDNNKWLVYILEK